MITVTKKSILYSLDGKNVINKIEQINQCYNCSCQLSQHKYCREIYICPVKTCKFNCCSRCLFSQISYEKSLNPCCPLCNCLIPFHQICILLNIERLNIFINVCKHQLHRRDILLIHRLPTNKTIDMVKIFMQDNLDFVNSEEMREDFKRFLETNQNVIVEKTPEHIMPDQFAYQNVKIQKLIIKSDLICEAKLYGLEDPFENWTSTICPHCCYTIFLNKHTIGVTVQEKTVTCIRCKGKYIVDTGEKIEFNRCNYYYNEVQDMVKISICDDFLGYEFKSWNNFQLSVNIVMSRGIQLLSQLYEYKIEYGRTYNYINPEIKKKLVKTMFNMSINTFYNVYNSHNDHFVKNMMDDFVGMQFKIYLYQETRKVHLCSSLFAIYEYCKKLVERIETIKQFIVRYDHDFETFAEYIRGNISADELNVKIVENYNTCEFFINILSLYQIIELFVYETFYYIDNKLETIIDNTNFTTVDGSEAKYSSVLDFNFIMDCVASCDNEEIFLQMQIIDNILEEYINNMKDIHDWILVRKSKLINLINYVNCKLAQLSITYNKSVKHFLLNCNLSDKSKIHEFHEYQNYCRETYEEIKKSINSTEIISRNYFLFLDVCEKFPPNIEELYETYV